MQLSSLTRTHTNKKARRVGRGGRRGKTSGRGTKGQKARSGHKLRPELRDIIKKVPKRRGYGKNRGRTVAAPIRTHAVVVSLSLLDAHFENGDTVTPQALKAKKLLDRRSVRTQPVKILSNGALTKKLTVSGCRVSASAAEAIEHAGGTVSS